jgi:hypothetical protein
VAAVGVALADKVDDGVEVLGGAPGSDRLGALAVVSGLATLHDGDLGRVAALAEVVGERNRAHGGTRPVGIEVVEGVVAERQGDGPWSARGTRKRPGPR